MKTFIKSVLIIISVFVLNACQTTKTAIFDQYTYQKTIEIKIETESLMDKANTPYNQNLQEIGELLQEVKTVMEYEKNRPNNEITYNMWRLLCEKDKNFIVGFLNQWQKSGTVSTTFIPEAKGQISEAFDLLIKYEVKKDKTNQGLLSDFINANN